MAKRGELKSHDCFKLWHINKEVKIKDRKVKQVLSRDEYQWERESKWRGRMRANMVHVLCIPV
jgi:hypothetical protein